jgi:transposase
LLTSWCPDAATAIFNLPDYRVLSTEILGFGQRRILVEGTVESGCPDCGVVGARRHLRRLQRVRDIPVGGPVEVIWSKHRYFCDESECPRGTFFEATVEVPRRARSTGGCGTCLSPRSLIPAAPPRRPRLRMGFRGGWPRMLGIDEHRFRSVQFFKDPETKAWTRFEPWMTTIVDLDTGQVLGVVDGRDHKGVGEWLFARPLDWRLGVQVVAIDPSAAFRKALRMWLPRTAVSVDAFHLVLLGNNMLTEVGQRLTQETKGRRGRTADPVWANRRLLLRAAETLSDRGQ